MQKNEKRFIKTCGNNICVAHIGIDIWKQNAIKINHLFRVYDLRIFSFLDVQMEFVKRFFQKVGFSRKSFQKVRKSFQNRPMPVSKTDK